MRKSKIYKIISVIVLLAIIGISCYYFTLPNRHKAIVKGFLLEKLGIVEKDWSVATSDKVYKMISPTFYIDGIYKSMEGPKSSKYVQLSKKKELLWLTRFEVKALDAKTFKPISNDFICHTNIDFNDVNYYTNLGLTKRIGTQYPRMTSLSHGMEKFKFPRGYGVPMMGNDILFVTSQSLNHNINDANFWIKHEVSIGFTENKKTKPLMAKTAFIMLPYDKKNPYKSPLDPASNQCIPVETKNHSYDDGSGNMLSGHWVIPRGKKTYSSEVTAMLQIKDSLRLHAAAIHVHPFATKICLYDATTKTNIFSSNIVNHTKNIGLTSIEPFESEEGIWLYVNHKYEIILDVNNTSNIEQDMMGSMFLFFYDKELDEILKRKVN